MIDCDSTDNLSSLTGLMESQNLEADGALHAIFACAVRFSTCG